MLPNTKMKMKWLLFLFIALSLSVFNRVKAQELLTDTIGNGKSIYIRDERVDLLGKKMAEYNEGLAEKTKLVSGFRLMVLNTTDRNYAMKVRAALLQQYPDQKMYMVFLTPYIKIKLGNFINKADAEKVRKKILDSKLVSSNIYIVSELVELKPKEKTTNTEE
jgi:hypothetical protein